MKVSLIVLSLLTASVGTVVYHVFQKELPPDSNPASFLAIAYLVAFGISAVALIVIFNPTRSGAGSISFSWGSVGLAAGIVLIEFGFAWMYRSGWSISVAALVVNTIAAATLVAVSVVGYGEAFRWPRALGMALCLLGIGLLAWTTPGSASGSQSLEKGTSISQTHSDVAQRDQAAG